MTIQTKLPKVRDAADFEVFSETVDVDRTPGPNRYLIERHKPVRFRMPYHHHTSIEINYLQNCRMDYSFSGKPVLLEPQRITLFWGAAPHRVTDVVGDGLTTNLYLSLGQFLRWSLPAKLNEAVLSGRVVAARPNPGIDDNLFDRLYAERNQEDAGWQRVHLSEIEIRLRRMALEGWDELLSPRDGDVHMVASAAPMQHVEAMLRFVADNFSRPVTAGDVAASVNLSQGHAMKLFRRIMGRSIKEHLTRTRLSHARMLLSDTEAKIVSIALDSGFRSLSSFYEAFEAEHAISPGKYRRDIREPRVAALAVQ